MKEKDTRQEEDYQKGRADPRVLTLGRFNFETKKSTTDCTDPQIDLKRKTQKILTLKFQGPICRS